MAGLINIGAAKIEVGDPAADGGMGTSLSQLGYTTEDTIKFNDEGGSEIDFPIEELDVPVYSITKAGNKTFSFQIANPDEDTLVAVFGGTKTGTGGATKWEAPLTQPTIIKSLRFTPQKGLGFNFPKTKLSARWTSDIGKNHLLGIEVVFKVLQPDKVGEKPYSTFRV